MYINVTGKKRYGERRGDDERRKGKERRCLRLRGVNTNTGRKVKM